MIIPTNIKFKSTELISEYQQVRARLQLILEDMAKFTVAHGYEFIITDLLSEIAEDKKLKRVSTTHLEGRGADIRSIIWPEWFKKKFENYFETKYKKYAAISQKTGLPNLIEIHAVNGNVEHCHVQIAPYKE